MVYNIEFLPKAEIDLDEIVGWYQQINNQLADDFLVRLNEALMVVQAKPKQFQ